MTRRFYGAPRPNHDGNFLPTSDNKAARWGGFTDGYPSNPHRRAISDAESRWNGFNPLEIGHEANTSDRRHDAPPQTMGKAAVHIIPPSWGGSTNGHPSNLHRRSIADAGHRWNGSNPTEIGHQANNSVRRHGAPSQSIKRKAALHIIPPSPPRRVIRLASTMPRGQGGSHQRQPIEGRAQAVIDIHESLPITRPIKEDEGWNKPSNIPTPLREQAQRSRVPDVDSNTFYNLNGSICEGTRQLGYATNICKVHNLAKKERMGRALQQFALLRRCFYPKRDVIKWRGEWNMRLSCEVSDIVQEPLKRLPFEANSTCVELPYATMMWWFGMVIERLTSASAHMPLGEHVHTLYARPPDRRHLLRLSRDPIPGASGAWLIAGV
jgi:hypothetical protein